MKKVGRETFLEYRKMLEQKHIDKIEDSDNPIDAILAVEINTTELCNRKCVFCPRVDEQVYPNQNLNMSREIAKKIAKRLSDVEYIGRISFSGYGENLLNKEFCNIIQEFRKENDKSVIECNTNGDLLSAELVKKLFESGLSSIYVNLYSDDLSIDKINSIFAEAGISEDRWMIRDHTNHKEYGLYLNNRSGMLKGAEKTVEEVKNRPCYYPFYKMMVDWNANVLFCTNDWGRKRIIGNLVHHSVQEIWLCEEMEEIRKNLIKGRRVSEPCKSCSVRGDLFGERSAALIMKSYE